MKKIQFIIIGSALTGAVLGGFYIVQQLKANERKSMESLNKNIKLPDPRYDSNTSIERALLKRRSVRDYSDTPLSLREISQILWAAQGITDARGLRTAPSAGALYPLEIYVVAGNVTGLPAGIYKYRPHNHELTTIVQGDKRINIGNAALNQPSIKKAAAVIVFSAIYERTTVKYGERGIRYVHMEVGHAAQNLCLQAVSLGLGTVVIGAFDDSKMKQTMNMEDKEYPLYLIPVGKIKI